ncbi:MAG: CHAT domain-containing tetratricopeptide repeat protein [Bacteroidota bacterium]
MTSPRAAIVCLAVAAVGLAWATDAQDGPETACEAESAVFREEYLNQRMEGPAEREDLLRRLRAFHARYADAPVCRQTTRDYEVVLLLLNGAFAETDSVLTETIHDPTFDVLSAEIQNRLLYNQGFTTVRLGRLGDAALYYYQAAALSDQIPAHLGVRSYSQAAASARDLNDLSAAVLYLDAAERILADSADVLEEAEMSRAGVLIERAMLSAAFAERAYTAPTRRASYAAMRSAADSAYAVLRGTTQDNEVGRMALALILRARAETQLGDLEAARRSLAQALPPIPQGISVFPDLRHSWWRNQTRLDMKAEDWERALVSSLRTEEEAHRLGTASALKLYNSTARTGRIYERLGRLEDAEASYRQAIALTEIERDRIGLQDWKASSFAEQQRPHRALARLLVQANQPWEAFELVDATRARTFRDLRALASATRALTPDARAHAKAIADSLATVRVELAATPDPRTRTALTTAIIALQDSMESTLGVRAVPPDPLTQADLQSGLASDQRVLISYLLGDDDGLAFVVRSDTLVAVPLAVSRDSIRARSDRLTAGWVRDLPDPAFERDLATQLYRDLIAPIAPLLPPEAPLTVLPDPAFAQLPLAALIDPETSDYLVRQHPITTELAAGLMVKPPMESPDRDVDVLAMGRSTFRGDGMGDLPFVPEEIREVRSHTSRARTALDDAATEEVFLETAPSARVVHIASHAFVDPAIPFNSRILLSPGSTSDGTLYLHELQNTRLDADLVVLSGCSTAQGQQHDGEGMIGLQYGVRVAGARAAVATLWPVDDRATVELMDALYEGLADGLSKDRALQKAQLAYLDASDARTASPFFWAGAVLSGDPEPVPLGGSRPGWALWLGLAALLGAVGLAWRLRSQISPA